MGFKKRIALFAGIILLISLAACGLDRPSGSGKAADSKAAQDNADQYDMEEYMRLFIGDTELSVAWENNASTDALIDLVKTKPLIIEMSMYGGFEQVGPLGTTLPGNDDQITTEAGDIVLYSGNRLVIFYGSNSWAYTRLGKITDKTAAEMAELLGNGNVTITISCGG